LKLRSSRYLFVAVIIAALLLCLPLTMLGDGRRVSQIQRYVPHTDLPKTQETEKWTFVADKVTGDHTSEYLQAEGNCTLAMGEDSVRADFARYYQSTGWVYLKGHIRAKWQGDFLEADEAEFDLNNKLGWLKNGRVFVAKPHVYVQAEHVERHPGDTYSFKNARVTRCSGETPAWSLTASRGDINLDGNVRVYHSAFRIHDIPVAYLPYASLPTGKRRESGFLLPEIGSSDKLGFRINQPYYWAINDEADATFYEHWMSKRGLMQGVELRYVPDTNTKAMVLGTWLYDDKVHNTEADESSNLDDDGLTRPNRNRWWAVGKYDGWLGSPQWKLRADIDLVSDQNYLREFKSGSTGFSAMRKQFIDQFGRDIDDIDDSNRTSRIYLSRSWDRLGVAGKVEYHQNLEYMNGNGDSDKNPSIQTLPELDVFAWKDSIPGTPLEFEGGAKYDYFTSNYGAKGHRLDLNPSISLPVRTRYLTFIPKGTVRQTWYYTDHQDDTGEREISRFNVEDSTDTETGFKSRFNWEGGASLFSELERIYQLNEPVRPTLSNAGMSRWVSLRHAITPRVEYTYSPNLTGQSELPYFDTRDRLKGTNKVTYSLNSSFDRKRERVVMVADDQGNEVPVLKTDYLDFLTFRLEQSYDRNEATRNDMRSSYELRPFSDFLAEVMLRPAELVSLSMRAWYSPYLGSITEHEHMLRLYKDGLGEVYAGLDFREPVDEYARYRDDRMSILRLGGKWNFANNLELGVDWRQNLENGKNVETSMNLRWRRECYDVIFYVKSETSDTSYGLKFDLFNF